MSPLSTKLTSVLADSTKDISTLFAAVAKPTDSLVSFAGSTTDTKNGSYLINVSALATQGKAVADGAAALTINAGSNDTLSLTVDGIAATVTLSAGLYTAAALAAEIQSKVNGVTALSAVGIRVAPQHAAVGRSHESCAMQSHQLADVLQLGVGSFVGRHGG